MDLNAIDNAGWTALMLTCKKCRKKVIKMLLKCVLYHCNKGSKIKALFLYLADLFYTLLCALKGNKETPFNQQQHDKSIMFKNEQLYVPYRCLRYFYIRSEKPPEASYLQERRCRIFTEISYANQGPLPDLAKKQPASFLPHIFVLIHVSVRNTERMQNYVFREAGQQI